MNTVTQITRRRQVIIEYSLKKGVTAAARRYNVSRQFVYRWKKRYDGTLASLQDRSHRPHSHPNQHTEEEIELIKRMRKKEQTYRFGRILDKTPAERLQTVNNKSMANVEQAGITAGQTAKSQIYTQTI